jgi:preprotein translocase subunit SecA
MDHIEAMEYLRDSVRLRAYGQRDPLVEYKIEGQKMFQQLMSSIGAQVANIIFKVSLVTSVKGPSFAEASEGKQETRRMEEIRPDIIGESHSHQQNINEPAHREEAISMNQESRKIGRNDPCWCNSGKKYKKCHGG